MFVIDIAADSAAVTFELIVGNVWFEFICALFVVVVVILVGLNKR